MRFLTALALLAAMVSPAGAATRHVHADGAGEYPTIQAAIDACAPGDTVLCAPGVYAGPGNRGLDFGGVDLVLCSSAGPDATIIDGGYADTGIRFQSGEGRVAVVEGFTITHCRRAFGGAGILCISGSPTLRELRLVENASWGEEGPLPGAGMTCWGGAPRLERVVLQGNTGGPGAGIWLSGPVAAELSQVEFSGGNFGGMLIEGAATASFVDVTFAESLHFPALQLDGVADLLLEGVSFRDNQGYTRGAAILSSGGRLVLRDCLFHDNSLDASDAGEGILDFTGTELVMEGCTLAHSRSGSGMGAALALHAPGPTHIERTLIAHGFGVAGITWDGQGEVPEFLCNDVFGHTNGNYAGALSDPTGTAGNINLEPIFCGPINDPEFAYTLSASSPCLPPGNDCGVQIGARGEGCPATGVAPTLPAAQRGLSAQPNPFNPQVTLRFDLAAPAECRLEILSVAGRRLRTLCAGRREAGEQVFAWDGRDEAGRALASGVYLARLQAPGRLEQAKLVLLR